MAQTGLLRGKFLQKASLKSGKFTLLLYCAIQRAGYFADTAWLP